MKIKESVYEISDVINKPPLDQTQVDIFKIFSLPFWLVVISIGFSCACQPVRAGTEATNLYYRYVPYQGPSSTTGTGSQATQQSSGASGEQAKKAEQAAGTGEKGGATDQAQGSGSQGATGQSTQQGSQDVNRLSTQQDSQGATGQGAQQGSQGATGQSTQQANAPKTECPMSAEKRPPAQRSEKSTGEFPSGTYPTFCQLDVNGDHYVTKDELQNFPELLRVFDKIDAGKDGKLEQHEFANLEMETSREGEF